jgi:hypothetical protein
MAPNASHIRIMDQSPMFAHWQGMGSSKEDKMMATITNPNGMPARREQDRATRPAPIFWMAALGAAALALLAVYGVNSVARPQPAAYAVTTAPATPIGDFVQLAERIKSNNN